MDFFTPFSVAPRVNFYPPLNPMPTINAIELTIVDKAGKSHRREYRKPDIVTPSTHPLAGRGCSILFGRMSSANQGVVGDDIGGYIDALGKVDFACPVMSRTHARIDFEDKPAADGYNVFIVDAGSHHGTFIKRDGIVTEVEEKTGLRNEDIIIFGKPVHKGGQTHNPLVAHVKLLVRSPQHTLFETFGYATFNNSTPVTRYGLTDHDVEVSDSDEASSQDDDQMEDEYEPSNDNNADLSDSRPRYISLLDESDDEDEVEIVQASPYKDHQLPIRLPDFSTLARDVEPIDVDQYPLPVVPPAARAEMEVIDVDAYVTPPLIGIHSMEPQNEIVSPVVEDLAGVGYGQNGATQISVVMQEETPAAITDSHDGEHQSQMAEYNNIQLLELQPEQQDQPAQDAEVPVVSPSAPAPEPTEKTPTQKELRDLVTILQESVRKLRAYRLKSRRRIILNKVEVDNRLDDVQGYMDELQQDMERINELIQDKGLSEVIETKNQIIEEMEEKEEEVRCEAEDVMHSYEDLSNEVESARDEIDRILEDLRKAKASDMQTMEGEIEAFRNMCRDAEETVNKNVASTKRKLEEMETEQLGQATQRPVKRARGGFLAGLLVGGTAVCVGLSFL
ncbi:hypothetical protein FRC02_011713 [Tulasnella sp. 418]|nr:hypothetical protein FRC02_011713 [Tulasnella sp. 418]